MNYTDIISVVLTGLVVVFLALILLIVYFSIQGKLFSQKTTNVKKNVPPAKSKSQNNVQAVTSLPQVDSDEDEVVAVISAAIASLSLNDGKTYKVKSIKPAKNISSVRSAWAMAGLHENTTPF